MDFITYLGAPAIEWQKCLGGNKYDRAYSVVQITDNGFVIVGQTYSNNGDVSHNYGHSDAWIVKLDESGNMVWENNLGGSGFDILKSIRQTLDGGFIVAGSSGSNDHDVTGNHGFYDFWVIKMNLSGYIEWQKVLGGSSRDDANFIQQTNDGGYIVVGNTSSNDGDVSGNHNEYVWDDYWVVKLDSFGNIEWQKCFGGSDDDYAHSVTQTTDGGYVVAGSSYSNDGDITDNRGRSDYFVVKLNASGNVEWKKSYGGSDDDWASSVLRTNDNGCIVFGYTGSIDGDVTNENNTEICWIIRLDSSGNLIWEKSIEGEGIGPYLTSANYTSDGGYILSGSKNFDDYWVAKINQLGDVIWQKTMGGSEYDEAFSVQQTNDFGYIVTGYSSSNNGDVFGQHGLGDFWVVKLASETASTLDEEPSKILIYPNPTNDVLYFSEKLNNIEVYSVNGKKVISLDTANQLNIAHLLSGAYFLNAKTVSGKAINKKFVKN